MVRYLFRLSYIGTPFSGVQRQSRQRVPTVVDALEHSINVHTRLPLANEFPCRFHISSRTDAGVHAFCNAGHVDLIQKHNEDQPFDVDLLKLRLNHSLSIQSLPVRILDIRVVPPEFDCRRHAIGREYVFRICVKNEPPTSPLEPDMKYSEVRKTHLPLFEWKRAVSVNGPLDITSMKEAMTVLEGTHNFRTFTTKLAEEAGKLMTRTVEKIEFQQCAGILSEFDISQREYTNYSFTFKAPSYLHRQVRKMTGALISVARSKITPTDVKKMLDNPGQDSWNNKIFISPAEGLYLKQVLYDENDFVNPRQIYREVVEEDDDNIEEDNDDDEITPEQEDFSGIYATSKYRLPPSLSRDSNDDAK